MKPQKEICFLVNIDWFYISHREALADMFIEDGFKVSVIAGKSKENKLINMTTFEVKSRIPTLFGLFEILKIILFKERKSIFIVVSPVMIFSFHFFLFFKKFAYYNFSGFGFIRSLSLKRQSLLFSLMNYMPIHGNRIMVVQNKHDYNFLKNKITSKKIQIRLIPGSGYENNSNSITSFNSNLTLGFVGRVRKDKGILTLIKAVNELKKANYILDLVIWGEIDYEGGHQFTNKELDFLNKNKLYFRGSSSSKPQIYSSFDVFCLPSSGEGLSKAAIEASSFGKPLILSDVPGNSDMINKNGFLFKYNDVNDLKSKILILNSMNIDEIKSLSIEAKQNYIDNWSLKSISRLWIDSINKDII